MWILKKYILVDDGLNGVSAGKLAWDAVKALKAGLLHGRSICYADQDEIAAVFTIHFTELCGREPEFAIYVLDTLPQLPVADDMLPPPPRLIMSYLQPLPDYTPHLLAPLAFMFSYGKP